VKKNLRGTGPRHGKGRGVGKDGSNYSGKFLRGGEKRARELGGGLEKLPKSHKWGIFNFAAKRNKK